MMKAIAKSFTAMVVHAASASRRAALGRHVIVGLTALMMGASALLAGGCGKPYPMPPSFKGDEGEFFVDRYFGQYYEDEQGVGHLSRGVRIRVPESTQVVAPVAGIIEYCPVGVPCPDRAKGVGTIRLVAKPKDDTLPELDDVPVPQHIYFEGIKVGSLIDALADPNSQTYKNPETGAFGMSGAQANQFVSPDHEVALLVNAGWLFGTPACERDLSGSCITDPVAGLKGAITLAVSDSDGHYVDPFLYLDVDQVNMVAGQSPGPLQALSAVVPSTEPVIEKLTLFKVDPVTGAPTTGGGSGLAVVDDNGQDVFVLQNTSNCASAGAANADPFACDLDIVVSVSDLSPGSVLAELDANNAVVLTGPNPDPNVVVGVRRFYIDIYDPNDPNDPNPNDAYAYDPNDTLNPGPNKTSLVLHKDGTTGPLKAEVACLPVVATEVWAPILFDANDAPTSLDQALSYNITQLLRRTKQDFSCLPKTQRERNFDLTDINLFSNLASNSSLAPNVIYDLVVIAEDYSGQRSQPFIVKVKTQGGALQCHEIQVASCTAAITEAGSGCSGATKLELEVPLDGVCIGDVSLTTTGNVEVLADDCSSLGAGPVNWQVPLSQVGPWTQTVYVKPGPGADDYEPATFSLSYTNGATCSDSYEAVLSSSGNAIEPEGICCMEHDTPGCADMELMACVCSLSHACCDVSGSAPVWDEACVEHASTCLIQRGDSACRPNQTLCGPPPGAPSGTTGTCDGNESCETCPLDCGNCPLAGDDPTASDCPDVSNAPGTYSVDLGPITIPLPSGTARWLGHNADDNTCSYKFLPGPSDDWILKTEGYFPLPPEFSDMDLGSVELSWREEAVPAGSTRVSGGVVKAAALTWTGNKTTPSFMKLAATLKRVTVGIDDSAQIFGEINFDINQTGDVAVGPVICLNDGTTGKFVYRFDGTTGWDGTWDFRGISAINLDVTKFNANPCTVPASHKLAKATGSISATGNLTATLSTSPGLEPSYNLGITTFTVKDMSLKFSYDLRNNDVDFISGTGKFELSNIPSFTGTIFEAQLTFDPQQIAASIGLKGSSQFSILGLNLSDLQIGGVMDYNFDLLGLNGSVDANHDLIDGLLDDLAFEMNDDPSTQDKDLKLTKLSVKQASVGFRGFELSINNGLYQPGSNCSPDPQKIALSAKLVVPYLGQAQLTKFRMEDDCSNPVPGVPGDYESIIDIRKMKATLTKPPVTGYLEASYSQSGGAYAFHGQADLDFFSVFTLGVQLDTGVEPKAGNTGQTCGSSSPCTPPDVCNSGKCYGPDDFFTYLHLLVSVGIPIPLPPIKLTEFMLEGGYNWKGTGIDIDPNTNEFTMLGEPDEGSYVAGVGLGVSDVAGLIGIKGIASVTFGNDPPTLTLAGLLSVPASDPWLAGSVSVNAWTIGSAYIDARLQASLNIPGKTYGPFSKGGLIETTNPLIIEYVTSPTGYSIGMPNPATLSVFGGALEITGQVHLSSTYGPNMESAMSGILMGRIDVGGTVDFAAPSGFTVRNSYGNIPSDDEELCEVASDSNTWWGWGAYGTLTLELFAEINAQFGQGGFNGGFGLGVTIGGALYIKYPCPLCWTCVYWGGAYASASFALNYISGAGVKVTGSATIKDVHGEDITDPRSFCFYIVAAFPPFDLCW